MPPPAATCRTCNRPTAAAPGSPCPSCGSPLDPLPPLPYAVFVPDPLPAERRRSPADDEAAREAVARGTTTAFWRIARVFAAVALAVFGLLVTLAILAAMQTLRWFTPR